VRIGTFEVLGELGRGGMGVVYRGRGADGREVAIKVVTGAWLAGEKLVDRFERERRIQAAFTEAEGFVPVLEVGESEKGPFVVMPLVPGGTLRDRLKRGPLPVEEAVALGRALAAALGRAHGRGVVHRDLKPENVLFDGAGRSLAALVALCHYCAARVHGSEAIGHQATRRPPAKRRDAEQVHDAARARAP
jgi:serine/threonine protein kinase